MVQYLCPNCGAPYELSINDLAVKCSYCGTTFRTFVEERRYVLPAHYDSGRAMESFLLWVKKQLGYEESLPLHIYIKDARLHFYPFWTSTILAKVTFRGLGEDAVYERPYMDGYRRIRIVHREEEGAFERFFEYSIPASDEVPAPDELISASRSRIYFSHEYVRSKGGVLHGATLTREEAKRIMEQRVRRELSKLVMREVAQVNSQNVDLEFGDFTLVYIPIWRVTYSFKGRDYVAVIDASSSRVIHATYPPDIAEKAGYIGLGAGHMVAGAALAALLIGHGIIPAATALLGLLSAGLVYLIRGAAPAKAGERV